jgi:alpha-galactosidase
MSKFGLLALGYEYVNVDDCWSSSRDPNNNTIIPDYTKFPNGMAYVADQLHAAGFKFGMYSDAGNNTVNFSFNPPSYPSIKLLTTLNRTVRWLSR